MANDTRSRILAVASELFTDQGYDGTSLREISDRLGFTKAALYYHFQSKEQILLALLEPADAMVSELLRRLSEARDIEEWGDALIYIVGQVYENMAVMRLMARNRSAVQEVWGELDALKEHAEWHQRVEQAVRDKAADLHEQVRMISALAAVTGFDDWAPTILAELPRETLREEMIATVRDILELPRRKPAARRQSRAKIGVAAR